MFKILEDILAELKLQTAIMQGKPVVIQPTVPPGPPLYPCQPTPPVNHQPSLPGGRYDSSLILKEPYHRHEVYLVDGVTVRYTLPAGQAAVSFTVQSYDGSGQGRNPTIDRWVEDAAGHPVPGLAEMGISINGGGMSLGSRRAGPLYLCIKPHDFSGLAWFEYQ